MMLCSHAFRPYCCSIFQRFLPIGKSEDAKSPPVPRVLTGIQIVATLGFGKTETYLIQAPP